MEAFVLLSLLKKNGHINLYLLDQRVNQFFCLKFHPFYNEKLIPVHMD